MEFRKYHSSENSYQRAFIDKIILSGLSDGEFVVQEKVHGANFSFWYDGKELKYAKRTEFIIGDDGFYDFSKVAEKYKPKIEALYEILNAKGYQQIAVFGELFGGKYPHADVKTVKNAVVIQNGVYYTPENDFYAFDILADDTYLCVNEANEFFEKVGFLYAKTLFQGSFKACLDYPNAFNSYLPQWLGLPLLDNNLCEGVIIKPVETRFFNGGSRVIIKNKNEKWSEKVKVKKNMGDNTAYVGPNLSPEAQEVLANLLSFITENRLRNVISKEGNIEAKDFGKLIGLFNKDIYADFIKEYESDFLELEKIEQAYIKKRLNGEGTQLIRKNLHEILGGGF